MQTSDEEGSLSCAVLLTMNEREWCFLLNNTESKECVLHPLQQRHVLQRAVGWVDLHTRATFFWHFS